MPELRRTSRETQFLSIKVDTSTNNSFKLQAKCDAVGKYVSKEQESQYIKIYYQLLQKLLLKSMQLEL